MGTLSYILLYRHNIKIVKTTQTIKMPKGSGLTKPLNLSAELADLVGAKKGEALKTRGCQAPLGPHQGPEAPGPREQAVLHPRRQDDPHLGKGQGPCLRYGQVPQDSLDQLNYLNSKMNSKCEEEKVMFQEKPADLPNLLTLNPF